MDKFRDVNRRTRIEQALSGRMSDGRRWKEKTSNQICDLKLLVVEAVEAKVPKFCQSRLGGLNLG